MTCAMVTEKLDDFVDGGLEAGEAQAVAEHLARCASCREAETGLRQLLEAARALPRERAPERDLWPAMAAELRPRPHVAWVRGGWPRPAAQTLSLLAAAAVVAAASSLLTLWLAGRGPEPQPVQPETGLAPAAFETGLDLAAVEAEYEQAALALRARLDSQKQRLSPETAAVVEKNLAVIDEALEQVRAALRRDPANRELLKLLASTHRRRLDVLHLAVRSGAAL
jgi:hypothetical protein